MLKGHGACFGLGPAGQNELTFFTVVTNSCGRGTGTCSVDEYHPNLYGASQREGHTSNTENGMRMGLPVVVKSLPFLGSFVIMYVKSLESLSDPFSTIGVPHVESSITSIPTTSLASGTLSTLRNLNSNRVGADDSLLPLVETEYHNSSPLA
jgi:hypothetical protein